MAKEDKSWGDDAKKSVRKDPIVAENEEWWNYTCLAFMFVFVSHSVVDLTRGGCPIKMRLNIGLGVVVGMDGHGWIIFVSCSSAFWLKRCSRCLNMPRKRKWCSLHSFTFLSRKLIVRVLFIIQWKSTKGSVFWMKAFIWLRDQNGLLSILSDDHRIYFYISHCAYGWKQLASKEGVLILGRSKYCIVLGHC
jgi:hypothetical protein